MTSLSNLRHDRFFQKQGGTSFFGRRLDSDKAEELLSECKITSKDYRKDYDALVDFFGEWLKNILKQSLTKTPNDSSLCQRRMLGQAIHRLHTRETNPRYAPDPTRSKQSFKSLISKVDDYIGWGICLSDVQLQLQVVLKLMKSVYNRKKAAEERTKAKLLEEKVRHDAVQASSRRGRR